jgi:NTP pyrophosphatase (non-canonical NTP hydrolase)
MIQFEEYPAFCRSIWQLHDERSLVIAGLGIVGEACEVGEALLEPSLATGEKATDECGDVLYYATVLMDHAGLADQVKARVFRTIDTTRWSSPRLESGLRLCVAAKEVSERVKKKVRDGAPLDGLDCYLYDTLVATQVVLNGYGRTLRDALDGNVAKLEKRYCTGCGAHRSRCSCATRVA